MYFQTIETKRFQRWGQADVSNLHRFTLVLAYDEQKTNVLPIVVLSPAVV